MKQKRKASALGAVALACALTVCSVGTVSYADDSIGQLEEQTSDLQGELDSLQSELDGLSTDISYLASKIEETTTSIEKAQLDLAAAKVNEELQYDAMKKRIKYMYEAGNTSLLHIIFSSESMADFLNNTEFVRNVTEYDRNKLAELQDTRRDIAEKENTLLEEQQSLEQMKQNLNEKQETLNEKISSTSQELDASSEALQKAKDAQAAAQAALEQQQQQGATSQGGQSSGSSGTITVPSTPAQTTDLVLFAALLQCEAGSSSYDALLAVATVVMNRVESPRYPNTLYGVIYQSGQFSPTWNGSLNRVLARGPASICYQVAQDALNGSRLTSVSGCYSFRASWTGHAGTVVGGNVFF